MEVCSGEKEVSVLVPNLTHYVWQRQPHVLQTYPSVCSLILLLSQKKHPTPEYSGRENLSIRGLVLHTNY